MEAMGLTNYMVIAMDEEVHQRALEVGIHSYLPPVKLLLNFLFIYQIRKNMVKSSLIMEPKDSKVRKLVFSSH
jgi:hypothetical protein